MMTRRRFVARTASLALVLSLPRVGSAEPGPGEWLSEQIGRVVHILGDPAFQGHDRAAERRAALRAAAADIFDFAEAARRCLGRHWTARTPGEQDEFVRLFAGLLERSYLGKIEHYSGESIEVSGAQVDGDQAAVRTRIVTRQGTEVPVHYRLHRPGDRWMVYDVVIEGASLVANYRAQFNKIIRTSSYDELVTRLRGLLEQPRRTSLAR